MLDVISNLLEQGLDVMVVKPVSDGLTLAPGDHQLEVAQQPQLPQR